MRVGCIYVRTVALRARRCYSSDTYTAVVLRTRHFGFCEPLCSEAVAPRARRCHFDSAPRSSVGPAFALRYLRSRLLLSPGVLIQSGQIADRLGEMTRARFVSATGLPFGPSDNHLTMRRVGVSARASWKMAPSIGPLGRARRLGGVAFGASELTTAWFQIFVGRAPVIRLLAHASEAARRS